MKTTKRRDTISGVTDVSFYTERGCFKTTKTHYCVLYVRVAKQHKVADAIREMLPEDRGVVFYPCTELWWHGKEETVVRPLFPGYLFIRSDMSAGELFDLVRSSRREEISSFIRTLNIDLKGRRKTAGEKADASKDEEGRLFDLSDSETEFLDFLLNFSKRDAVDENAPGYFKLQDRKDIPETGVIRMSRGYRENGRIVVMEGPLRGYEEHIVDVNIRDRKAYLDLSINGHIAKAGLELWGKRHWFPEDRDAPAMLEDGTEVDLDLLARNMMDLRKEGEDPGAQRAVGWH